MASTTRSINAQLTPIFAQDLVAAGIFYFALINSQAPSDVRSWWVVLRCPEEILPQPFLDVKEPSSRAFPFWAVGRSQFIWLVRDNLFLLHQSQKSAFDKTILHHDFERCFDLATGSAKSDPLGFFERDIAKASRQVVARRAHMMNEMQQAQSSRRTSASYSPGDSLFVEELGSDDTAEAGYGRAERPLKRPKRMQTSVTRAVPRANRQLPRTAYASSTTPVGRDRSCRVLTIDSIPAADSVCEYSTEAETQIKTEEEAYQIEFGKGLMTSDRVNVHLGPQSKIYPASKSILDKSPVFRTHIQHDGPHGLFLMHPELASSSVQDFLAVLEFMQVGKYKPHVVSRPDGHPRGPKALEGLSDRRAYSTQLVRSARLYVLATSFKIPEMAAHIFEKIVGTQYISYSCVSLIQAGAIVFGVPGATGRNSRDDMENWIIKQLAEHFKDIMDNEAERRAFWQMESDTEQRKLMRDILAQCAEDYHRIGGLVINIED